MTEKAPNYMINFWEQQGYEDKDGNSMVDSSGGII